ncbi:divergent polysaccharide deacetylase family protein [Henriciella marina]|uniref:divergent polysaccharide deacetylase family protein n=1 Tax=Henriciella marina TaxID=453851 RepID=UPI000368ED83|nr:divergent polysaccharide deacetylase family protein [Henriciella marina]
MQQRVTHDPSPLRSGVVHGIMSCCAFALIVAGTGTAIHLWGDDASASPVRQIALFEPEAPTTVSPQLKTRLAAANPPPARPSPQSFTEDAPPPPFVTDEMAASGPDLGVEYTNGTSRIVSVGSSGEASQSAPTVRINGVSVSTGQSWQDTRSAIALPPAPVSAVSEPALGGQLPKIADDGRTPAGVYARPFANPEGRPTVSIILGGLGINRTHTRSAIEELPPEVTLSFAPTTYDLQGWIDRARAAGHEVLLEVPMETYEIAAQRPAPNTLMVAMDDTALEGRLNTVLASATGYFGITNYQGGRFARDDRASSTIARLLSARGLAFVEDGSLSQSAISAAAGPAKLRYRSADTQIDTRPDGGEIQEKLLELETLALENGAAVGAGFAYPVTIDILKAWTEQLSGKGVVLAPASAATHLSPDQPRVTETASADAEPGGQLRREALDTTG